MLVPALVSAGGPGSQLLRAARSGQFDLIISSQIVAEVRDALTADFRLSDGAVADLLRLLEDSAEMVEPERIESICRDPSDDPILALAAESGASFLATYDHDQMTVGAYRGCGVIHPATAVQLVRGHEPSAET